jgi:hypothetical protein
VTHKLQSIHRENTNTTLKTKPSPIKEEQHKDIGAEYFNTLIQPKSWIGVVQNRLSNNMQTNDNNNTAAAAAVSPTSSSSSDNTLTVIKTMMKNISSGEEDELEIPVIKLGTFWDEWSRCIGSRYQADHLYRVGTLDSCARQWRDLKTATRARLLVFRDPKTAKELLDSTYYKKRTTISPTAGAIWELKEIPGWDLS